MYESKYGQAMRRTGKREPLCNSANMTVFHLRIGDSGALGVVCDWVASFVDVCLFKVLMSSQPENTAVLPIPRAPPPIFESSGVIWPTYPVIIEPKAYDVSITHECLPRHWLDIKMVQVEAAMRVAVVASFNVLCLRRLQLLTTRPEYA